MTLTTRTSLSEALSHIFFAAKGGSEALARLHEVDAEDEDEDE